MNKNKKMKMTCVLLSLVVVLFSLFGNIVETSSRGLSLLSFESFYVYILLIVVIIYAILKDKNANVFIVFALFTYLWTYLLVNKMTFSITDVGTREGVSYYIYLSSIIFLILSLSFNDKKKTINQENSKEDNPEQIIKEELEDSIDKNNFIFTNIILGIKKLSLNSIVLLVNNTETNTIDLIYNIDKQNQTIKIPLNDVKNITFENKVKMTNNASKVEDNETKSELLSMVMFGGNPIMQMVGGIGFNNLFDSISNNYDKVKYNVYYEIVIEASIKKEAVRFILSTDTNPEEFVNLVSKNKA